MLVIWDISARPLWNVLKSYEEQLDRSEAIIVYRDPKVIRQLYLTIMFMLYQTCHKMYMTLSPVNDMNVILNYNLAYMLVQDNLLNTVWALISLMSAMFYHIFYFNTDREIVYLLKHILFNKNYANFEYFSKFNDIQSLKAFLRRFARRMLIILKFFILMHGKWILH